MDDFIKVYNNKPKLLDQLKKTLRLKHCSLKTEKSYVNWGCRFILFHNKQHPQEMGTADVQVFLNFLAVELHVSPVPIFVDTETSMLDNNETGGPGVPEHVKHRRKYAREFKVQAAKLLLEDGKTVKEMAEDLGICP